MSRTGLAFVAVGAILVASMAAIAGQGKGEVWVINANLEELLSGIDFVPSRTNFDDADVGEADIIEIARNDGADPGQRIRAYRALAHYPGPGTEKALNEAIEEHGKHATLPPPLPVETIYLRASMHSLAEVTSKSGHGQVGVDKIAPLLNHPSRDVRTDAARALAVCGSATTIALLRDRLALPEEDSAQVKFALAEAIRVLSEQL